MCFFVINRQFEKNTGKIRYRRIWPHATFAPVTDRYE